MPAGLKRAWGILLAVLCLAPPCTRDTEPDPPDTGINAVIVVVSGNHQTGRGGVPLPDPVVLRVDDLQGNPLANLDLSCGVVEGGGSVGDGSALATDASGSATIRWTIGSGYNGIEVSLGGDGFRAAPAYLCAVGDRPSGIHVTRTIASLRRVGGELYEMTFYGNYLSETVAGELDNGRGGGRHFCSLFAVMGDRHRLLMGRSFDSLANWVSATLLTRVNPLDGYASLAPVRMRDVGFAAGMDFNRVPFDQKTDLLRAMVNPPDGLNEHGLTVGLANVTAQPYDRDPDKETITCVRLVRKILDQARTVEEAAAIALRYNIHGPRDTLDIHAMVVDATGRSIILEPAAGQMRVIPSELNFQVMTNSPVYGVSLDEQIDACWRFRTIFERLEACGGIMDAAGAMGLLAEVGNEWTEWSAVYGIWNHSAILAVDFDFTVLYPFPLFPLW